MDGKVAKWIGEREEEILDFGFWIKNRSGTLQPLGEEMLDFGCWILNGKKSGRAWSD
jgi:hypothetical protein